MKKLKEFWNDYKISIIGSFITLVLICISVTNDKIANIIEIVSLGIFGIFVIIFVSVVVYFVIRKKIFLRKIDPKDLEIVKKYKKKNYHELEIIEIIDIENKHEYSLYDEFCDVWDMANMFGEYNRLNVGKEDILTDDFINYIKKLDNKDVNNILEESMKVKEIVFKYYDSNGVWNE